MKGKLYINSILVDDGIDIPIKITSNDLNDLNDKRSGQSYTAILTKTNYLHEDSTIWETNVYADYEVNGYFLIKKGEVRVNKFTESETHLTIYFGAINLTTLLGDKKINELVVLCNGVATGQWNMTNILNFKAGDDLCYILCNPNTESWNHYFFEEGETLIKPMTPQNFFPVVKATAILEAIKTDLDIDIIGDIVGDEYIDKLYMPLGSNFGIDDYQIEGLTATTQQTEMYAFLWDFAQPKTTKTKEQKYMSTLGIITDGYKVLILEDLNYTIDYNLGLKTFSWVQLYLASLVSCTITISFAILKNGTLLYSKDYSYDLTSVNLMFSNIIDLADAPSFSLLAGDELTFYVLANVVTDPTDSRVLIQYYFTDSNRISIKPAPFVFGNTYKIGQNLPDITIINFLKSLIQKRGFILDFDNINEKFILKYYKRLYDNQTLAPDWSDKYISHEITDIYGIGGQKTIFEYTNDKEMPADYGSHIELINKTILPNEVLLLKDNTSATLMQDNNLTEQQTPLIPVLSENIEWAKINARFLMVEEETITEIYTNTDIVAPLNPIALTEVNMGWFLRKGKGKFNLDYETITGNSYEDFISNLNDYRECEALFSLSENDVIRSQDVPIYCKQMGGYFAIQEIVFTTREEVTKVKLIRL